ncbi:DUF1643 domain-containing protein [Lonepinella sp. BR2904]|uniref:DUF1643 domain-containing protein n=1 Tax=Lonepinella sp. BR2904 TaxID=3434551 RepID=UPI003F6E3483
MSEAVKTGAILSECRKYRYALWRIWDESKPKVMFIGLNPSTADETNDDRTITRCIQFAKSWGYGGIYMTNLFSYRATRSNEIYTPDDPIGKDNDQYILDYAKKSDKVIVGWGNRGSYLNRSKQVYELIDNLYCLVVNKTGEPKHPLYIASSAVPQEYKRK